MKNLLKLEELGQFALCVAALIGMDASWWAYMLMALGPDVGMLGYLIDPRVGAICYNVLHHKLMAIVVFVVGFALVPDGSIAEPDHIAFQCMMGGIILFGHASMDRIFGYGLKFADNFHHTHLGWIGKGKEGIGSSNPVS